MTKSYPSKKQTKFSFKQSAVFALLLSFCFLSSKAQTYCVPDYSSGTGDGDYISLVEIVSTTLNNNSGASPSPYYELFPASGVSTASLDMGVSYQVNVAGGTYGTCYIAGWGDWNHNGVFESSEYIGASSNAGNLTTVNFGNLIIPFNATPGITRIRFRSSDASGPGASDACGNTNSGYGETEDYEITILPLPACSGSPVAGTANSTMADVCAGQSFDLTLNGNTTGVSLDYQWQSSPDNVAWTNYGPVQQSAYLNINNLAADSYFRCVVTCSVSTLSDNSSSVFVNLKAPIDCYCMPDWSTGFTVDCTQDKFTDFSLANLVSQPVTICDSYGFTDSTTSNYATINLTAGNTYTLMATTALSGSNGDGMVGAWIDYNQNSAFDANEFISLGFGPSGTYSNTFTIPTTALGGDMRIRIMLDAYNAYSGTLLNPCSSNLGGLGQIIDYKVNMTPAPPCSGTPNAGDATATATNVCSVDSYTLNLINNDPVSNISYQWQSSPDGSVWTNLGSPQITIPYAIASQTATTYYRCLMTCLTSSLTGNSTQVIVNQNLPTACYCIPESINCGSSQITNIVFETINDSPVCDGDGYSDNTGAFSAVNLTANQTYTIATDLNIQGGIGYIGCWIDYDQNGFFDSNEYTDLGNTSSSSSNTVNITVPFTAAGGNTRMRVKMESTWGSFGSLDPCFTNEYDGQTVDYLINIIPATPCSGTPNAGDATSTITITCQNNPIALNLVNNDIVSDLIYQWQSSPDNVSWTNSGASQTTVPYTVMSQSALTYYRCLTTCPASSMTGTSTAVMVSQNPYTACYCIPDPNDCNGGDEINSVVFSTLTNTSTCSMNGYEDYTASVASATINAGQSYTTAVTLGVDNSDYVSVWIDYDHSGTFDVNEYTFIGEPAGSGNYVATGTISIPVGATFGDTRMRVRNYSWEHLQADMPCSNPSSGGARIASKSTLLLPTTYGETEDYLVTILPPDCGSINFPPITVTGASNLCWPGTIALDINPQPQLASGITYQWNSSIGSGFSNDGPPSTTSSFTTAPLVTTYYYCELLCNGSVVRTSDTSTVGVGIISSSPTLTNVSCNGLCDAALASNATSSLPLTYSWTPAVGTGDAVSGLCAGSYTVVMTNSLGCEFTGVSLISEPAALTESNTPTNVTCFGLNDGSISVTPGGGTMPYNYVWSGGETTSNLTNLSPGIYSYTVTDANNCMVSYSAAITEPTALTATASQTNVTCFGGNDGAASVNPAGGTGAFTYAWLPTGGVAATATGISAQSYTCTITDANNCTLDQVITLTEAPQILLSISGATTLCEFSTTTYSVSATNGVGAVTYTWSTSPSAQSSNNTTFDYTAPITGIENIYVSATDANGCSQTSAAYPVNVLSSTNISGSVLVQGTGAIVAGKVILYKYESFFTKFDSIDIRTIDAAGNYSFNNSGSGTYIVKAIPDLNNLQITYGDSAISWMEAKQIAHGCVGNAIANIDVKALSTFTATTGLTGSLSGMIYEGDGYGQRTSQVAAPGNPIGGIIVKGGKNPGGQMFVQTTSGDGTNGALGTYTLSGLPTDGQEFFVLVDIPGLDTNSTYHRVITITNNTHTHLDFMVDSAKITPMEYVGVNEIGSSSVANQIKVFPNPTSKQVTIQYNLITESEVKIELYDLFGKSVRSILPETTQRMDKHSYTIPLENIAAGMYFVKLKINNSESVIKLFITD